MPPTIVLATINARYAHASLALRYLRANLGELRQQTVLVEHALGVAPEDMAERLLALGPRIVGLSVYVWNVVPLTRVVRLLKDAAPDLVVVLGGPEVSHEVAEQPICGLADYVVTGWGEVTFARLARQLLGGERPSPKVQIGVQAPLSEIALPYDEYSDEDLRSRRLYVEASRGCPWRCAFCLSALDRTLWPFPLDAVLGALDRLYSRGARRFTFVDRTFNLRIDSAIAILGFFLERLREHPDDPPFVHVELVPDHLPGRLKGAIAAFPPGSLQLEIGVQTFDPSAQVLISRRQDTARTDANLRWLRNHTHAHLHVDLILGLPGEDLASFAAGFDHLVRFAPHEIQVGVLKRLRGAPIAQRADAFGLRFDAAPPYGVLETDRIDAGTMQRMVRFARYWDLIGNSGRFVRTRPLLLGDRPFERFLACSDWLHHRLDTTHGIPAETLYEALFDWLTRDGQGERARASLLADYVASGARGRLAFAPHLGRRHPTRTPSSATPTRQQRHRRDEAT